MNKIERIIYDFVKKNPMIKDIIRDSYQIVFSFWPKRKEIARFKSKSRKNYFFGFHDKSPWSFDNKYLLANRFEIQNRKILSSDYIEVGYFEGEKHDNFIMSDKTKAFNWQQGCMLQWVGNSHNFIYNSLKDNHHISIIKNVDSKTIAEFSLPVANVDSNGKYGLSYNFTRLAKYFQGYGYENGIDNELNEQEPNEGLNLFEIEGGNIKKLFSVKDIASINRNKSMDRAFHFFTHCLFSPSGSKFAFYHRWTKKMNYLYTRIYIYDLKSNNLKSLPTDNMVSHYGWRNDNELLAYCKVMDNKDAYYLFNVDNGSYELIGENSLTSDGHPSFCPTIPSYFVTDTYPNKFKQCSLHIFNIENKKLYEMGKFKQPLSFKDDLRCDLHPRWNRDGTSVCFDSAHLGIRSLCTMEIDLSKL